MTSTAAKAAGVLAGVAVGAAAKGIWEANKQYEILMAQLTTLAGGDVDKAKAQFDQLQDVATKTPFQLTEVVQAYSRLKAAGFEASAANIMALGDLATASNKELGDVVEAMLSANRGLGSMVDNFNGLSAKAQKGNLALKNAADSAKDLNVKAGDTAGIEKFFTEAGKTNGIVGAMENRMKTLDGRMSNLRDNAWKLWVALGSAGLRQAMGDLLLEFSKGVDGSQSIAAVIGGALAKAVGLLTQGLRWLKGNWELVGAAAAVALAAFKITQWAVLIASMGGVKAAIAAAAAAAAPFAATFATVVAPLLVAAGALTALGLILEDLWFYFQGGPSLIGEFISKFAGSSGAFGSMAEGFEHVLSQAKALFDLLRNLGAQLLGAVAPDLAGLSKAVSNAFTKLREAAFNAINTVGEGLGAALIDSGNILVTLGE
ncbi:MAG: hypothetical protein AAFX99_10180, partial [Myxococcota bacterium]